MFDINMKIINIRSQLHLPGANFVPTSLSDLAAHPIDNNVDLDITVAIVTGDGWRDHTLKTKNHFG